MSFSFAFDLDASEVDPDLDLSTLSLAPRPAHADPPSLTPTPIVPHAAVPLVELLATLPPLLSYTPVHVPLSATPDEPLTLLRRDLFDARFQILNQDETATTDHGTGNDRDDRGERFIDEGSDLVQGVYEGGLKTWECSLDLVDCFDQRGYSPVRDLDTQRVRGRSILELGCGTAVPSCALFSRLLNEIRQSPTREGEPPRQRTRIHLQDYNKQVLSLITLPNLLLTYAQHVIQTRAALSAADYETSRERAPRDDDDDDGDDHTRDGREPGDVDTTTTTTTTTPEFKGPGELDVTPELLESFEALLAREGIDLEFSEGDWSGMVESVVEYSSESKESSESEASRRRRGFDIVLTSETVYSLPSLPPLLDLLQAAAATRSTRSSSADDDDGERDAAEERHLCLVACKRIYFGVGGGELEFRRRVEERGGRVESVWGEGTGKGKSEGVGRTVLKVEW